MYLTYWSSANISFFIQSWRPEVELGTVDADDNRYLSDYHGERSNVQVRVAVPSQEERHHAYQKPEEM